MGRACSWWDVTAELSSVTSIGIQTVSSGPKAARSQLLHGFAFSSPDFSLSSSASCLQHDLSQQRTFWDWGQIWCHSHGDIGPRETFSFCKVPTAFIHDGVVPSPKELVGKLKEKKKIKMKEQRPDNLPVPPSVPKEEWDTLPLPQEVTGGWRRTFHKDVEWE